MFHFSVLGFLIGLLIPPLILFVILPAWDEYKKKK